MWRGMCGTNERTQSTAEHIPTVLCHKRLIQLTAHVHGNESPSLFLEYIRTEKVLLSNREGNLRVCFLKGRHCQSPCPLKYKAASCSQ